MNAAIYLGNELTSFLCKTACLLIRPSSVEHQYKFDPYFEQNSLAHSQLLRSMYRFIDVRLDSTV